METNVKVALSLMTLLVILIVFLTPDSRATTSESNDVGSWAETQPESSRGPAVSPSTMTPPPVTSILPRQTLAAAGSRVETVGKTTSGPTTTKARSVPKAKKQEGDNGGGVETDDTTITTPRTRAAAATRAPAAVPGDEENRSGERQSPPVEITPPGGAGVGAAAGKPKNGGKCKSAVLLERARAFRCVPGRTPERRTEFKPGSLGPSFANGLKQHLVKFPLRSLHMTNADVKKMKRLPLPPQNMLAPYTFNNSIHVSKTYFLSTEPSYSSFGADFVKETQQIVAQRKWVTYPDCGVVYNLIDDHPKVFNGRSAFIPGSEYPRFEILLREYAKMAHITTLEYRPFAFDYPNTTVFGVKDYWSLPAKKRPQYDVFWSYSNWEHDGLGRYGDPYNPYGDLDAIQESWTLLKHDNVVVEKKEEAGAEEAQQTQEAQQPNAGEAAAAAPPGQPSSGGGERAPMLQFSDSYGLLGLPGGKEDEICWNAHRVYGIRRLLRMMVGYQVVAIYDSAALRRSLRNPCHVVKHVKFLLRKICGPPAMLLDELFNSFRKALVKSEERDGEMKPESSSPAIEAFDEVERKYRNGTW